MILNAAPRKRPEARTAGHRTEPGDKRGGWPGMKPFLPLCALMALAACNRASDEGGNQPDIVANIVEDAVPQAGEAGAPADAVAPAPNGAGGEVPSPEGPVPAALRGSWTGMSDRCGDRAAALELAVGPDSLIFHESVGTVQAVAKSEDGATRVTAAFTGEGDSWTRTLTFRPSADGRTLVIVNDGAATTRKRC